MAVEKPGGKGTQENYDPNTGKYVMDGEHNKYYNNPTEERMIAQNLKQGEKPTAGFGTAMPKDIRRAYDLPSGKISKDFRTNSIHYNNENDETGNVNYDFDYDVDPSFEDFTDFMKQRGSNLSDAELEELWYNGEVDEDKDDFEKEDWENYLREKYYQDAMNMNDDTKLLKNNPDTYYGV